MCMVTLSALCVSVAPACVDAEEMSLLHICIWERELVPRSRLLEQLDKHRKSEAAYCGTSNAPSSKLGVHNYLSF
jgi:hypothetical protein